MNKKIAFCLVIASTILMAASCSTPANKTPIAPAPAASSFTVTQPPAVTPTPAKTEPITPSPVTTTAPAAKENPTPVPPPAPVSTPAPIPANSQVNIQNFAFNPAEITIAVGATVVWTNNDPVTHQIASNSFSSSPLNQGASFSQKFTAAGTYDYHCLIHPSMTGRVIVK